MYYLNSQLLYLIPVAALVAGFLVFVNWRRRLYVQRAFGQWDLLSQTSRPLSAKRYIARALLAALTAALIVFALARPMVPNGTKMIAEGTVDVLAVVDVSRSMAALDYDGKVPLSAVAKNKIEPARMFNNNGMPIPKGPDVDDKDAGTRLEMVRHIMLDKMIKELDGNQLGVVSYAGAAFPQAFLTRDAAALHWIVDRGLTISSAPGEGSGMGKALALALAMFDADSPPDHERILVLFSDGGNDDEPQTLAEFASEARQRGIKVIVVALGNVMPSKIPVSKLAHDDDAAIALKANGKRWLETADGQIEKSGMNAALLQNLANQAGGQFIHLTDASELSMLDHVGKTSMKSTPGTVELFPWVLSAAFICLFLTFAATHQWRRRSQS